MDMSMIVVHILKIWTILILTLNDQFDTDELPADNTVLSRYVESLFAFIGELYP